MPATTYPFNCTLNVIAGAVRHGVSQNELLSQSYIEGKFGDERNKTSVANTLCFA